MHAVRAHFQPQRGHQESQKHRAAIAHENFGGIEIPAEKTQRGAQRCGRQRANERLAIQAWQKS